MIFENNFTFIPMCHQLKFRRKRKRGQIQCINQFFILHKALACHPFLKLIFNTRTLGKSHCACSPADRQKVRVNESLRNIVKRFHIL